MPTLFAVDSEAVHATVERIVASASLSRSDQLVRFLRYIVAETLGGRAERLKEYTIGVEALGRSPKFDPTTDSVVRVQARQLRFKLADYFAGEGQSERVRIELPKGTYVPVFRVVETSAADSRRSPEPSEDSTIAATASADPVVRPSTRRRVISWRQSAPALAAAVVGIVIIGAMALPLSSGANGGSVDASDPRDAPHSVVVLPFLNLTGDPGEEYVSDGVTDELTAALANVPGLRVVARTSAYQFKSRATDIRTIGRQFGVESVVEGSVRRTGNVLRITVQLSRAVDGVHLWAASFDEPFQNVLAADEAVAREVVRAFGEKVTPELALAAPALPTRDAEAYDLYLKARYFLNRRDSISMIRARALFQQAIGRDSGFALAYAGLSGHYATMAINGQLLPGEGPPLAEAAARTALSLDPHLAEPHATLGRMRAFVRWDWAGSDSEFRRATQLDPNSASARSGYAMTLIVRDRIDEALAQLRYARRLDPLSYPIAYSIGEALYYARRWDEALAQARTVAEMDTTRGGSDNLTWRVFVATGRYAEALAVMRHAHASSAEVLALAGAGRMSEARERLRELSPDVRARTPYYVAALYAGVGETDSAFAWLGRAYATRQTDIVSMKVDPMMDPLRSDPRFGKLHRRIGIGD
jgi:TolB-like protein/tetratricopeptide (TPR) repeat protein